MLARASLSVTQVSQASSNRLIQGNLRSLLLLRATGRRRSLPCPGLRLSRTFFLRRFTGLCKFFSPARAFLKSPKFDVHSRPDINLLSLHPAPHLGILMAWRKASYVTAAQTALRCIRWRYRALSRSATAVRGERANAERAATVTAAPLKRSTLLPGVLRSSGFFAVAGGSRGATVMLRSIAGALQVLSSMRWWGSLCACGAHKTPPVPLYPVECATNHPTLRIGAPLPGRMRQDGYGGHLAGTAKPGVPLRHPAKKNFERRGWSDPAPHHAPREPAEQASGRSANLRTGTGRKRTPE